MKIQNMIVTPVAIADPPLRNAAGLHAPYALRVIIELVTNDGVSGLGEMPGGADIVADLEAVKHSSSGPTRFNSTPFCTPSKRILQRVMEPSAKRPCAPPLLRGAAPAPTAPSRWRAYDLIGKAINKPVCDVLGGRVRERVPFSAYLFFKHIGAGGALGFGVDEAATGWAAARQAEALDPDTLAQQAIAMCEAFGFKSIKLKGRCVGAGDRSGQHVCPARGVWPRRAAAH